MFDRGSGPPPADDYYERDRSEFLDWVGGPCRRVLDVGCAAGGNAAWFRANGASEIVGIEIERASADIARSRFTEVHNEPVEAVLPRLNGGFDLIVCADVLEHLVDPWEVLEALRTLATEDGRVAISIPNIRYYRALARITFGKGFQYEPEGIFDVTHLRFFTRSNVAQLLDGAGWSPSRWGSRRRRHPRASGLLSRLTRGISDEWLTYQWYVVATPDARSRKAS